MKTRVARQCFAIFLITASLLSNSAHGAQRDFQRLTVGFTPISAAALPFFIAVEERFFQKYGIEVAPIFMGGSPLINSAILAGEFPIGFTGGGGVVSSRLGGSDLIIIGTPLPVLTIDGWARPEIKSVADLKGKRVGVTRIGTSSYFAGVSMLDSARIKTNEVTFIQNGGVGESMAALLGGRVDVSMIGYPFGLRAKKEGFHMLFRPADTDYGFFPTAVITARESWLKDPKNRRTAVNFLRALREGQVFAGTDASVSKRALGKYTRVSDDAALQGSFDFYGPYFSKTLKTEPKVIANALKFLEQPKAKQADPTQFYDNGLVEEAIK
jgi:ABC-type nitrate/sulfonate/bicarbonate transport system substrate-binding protein